MMTVKRAKHEAKRQHEHEERCGVLGCTGTALLIVEAQGRSRGFCMGHWREFCKDPLGRENGKADTVEQRNKK